MSDQQFDILGLGCCTVDDLLYVESFPAPDTKQRVLERVRDGGGLTASALVAASRLGARCSYAAQLGHDELSQFVARNLARENIDLSQAFNSFQGLVRNQSPTGGLATTVGRYTLSWSMGIGLGFLLGGIFRSLNEPLLLALSVFISCSVLLGIVWSFKPDAQAENTTSSTRAEENSAVANPIAGIDVRYIAVAWTLLLTANFVQRPLTTFLPKFSAQAENPSWMAGVLLATMLFAQAITGYAMSRKTHWLYRLKPMFLVQIGVIALLGFLWFAQNFFVTILLMMCLGALHGFVYFASVYMASNSAQSARNIGINEMMVGIGNIGGMFFSAGAIRVAGFERAFFPATMILATLVLVWQMWWLRRGDRVVTS